MHPSRNSGVTRKRPETSSGCRKKCSQSSPEHRKWWNIRRIVRFRHVLSLSGKAIDRFARALRLCPNRKGQEKNQKIHPQTTTPRGDKFPHKNATAANAARAKGAGFFDVEGKIKSR